MKTSNLCRYLIVWLVASSLFSASAVITFTTDAGIGLEDTNYDGADIVITNCTLTVNGVHSFASLQILQGATLTHTAVANGFFSSHATITNEEHVLVGTHAEMLARSNVVLASIVVLDAATSVTYSNGMDYLVALNPNGLALLQRAETSAIPDGATVRVAYETSQLVPSGLNLVVAGDVAVEAGGAINVDGRGYDLNLGPGAGGTLGSIFAGGGGGGHGGYGGLSASNAPGGNVYDSILQPADKGSGGGSSYRGYGGPGGGAVKLVIGGALRIDGALSANGADGSNERSGGGAGGSLWLTAQTLSGAGSITAQGGRGEPSLGGGGGGGRIALYLQTNTFAGQVLACGGLGAAVGGAGTIYFKSPNQPVGSLLVDNAGRSGTNTLLVKSEAFDVTVQGGAILAPNSPAAVGRLWVNSNGWISCSDLTLTVSGDAVIRPGGGIIADGSGYSGGFGPGAGRSAITNGIAAASGGGYGGPGASTVLGVLGGISYGDFSKFDRGSGGGNVPYTITPNGGTGGGVLQMRVLGNLQVDGRISANGLAGLAPGSGGGAGGGLWLSATNLSGTGMLSACGGAGNGLGGGGGGGRIIIYCQTNTFNGSLQAWGAGSGSNCAGAGTIYLQSSSNPEGTLLVDNGGRPGRVTPLAPAQSYSYTLTLQGGANASFSASQTLRGLLIAPDSWLWLSNNSVTVLGDAIVQAGGGISVDAAGYPGNGGLGAGRTLTYYPAPGGSYYMVGGGAGHGGYGGAGVAGGAGNAYDSLTAPAALGSGGGDSGGSSYSLYLGGAGGGIARLSISNSLVLDGLLSANGAAAPGSNAGGGAGGSIWLAVNSLSGAGVICANGGAGNGLGGGGAGGRIAITYQTNVFAGAITALGAPGFGRGGAGTIYLQRASNQPGSQYIIDNGGQLGAFTDLGSFGPTGDLTIRGGAVASTLYPFSSKLTSLFIGSNSWLFISNQNCSLFIASNATIQAGGGINGNGGGSPAGSGQGAGRPYSSSPAAGGGGGYGGYGGIGGYPIAYGGNSYGPSLMPTQPGSGGATVGTNSGGAGGASLRLSVDGTLLLNGRISVDGNPGLGQSSGGGSGGALWLTVGSLLGAGSLSANGGAGALPLGGGGGGGRISLTVLSRTTNFTGSITAFGGGGFSRGGAGTIYTKNGSQSFSLVLVDNNGLRGTNTTFTDSAPFDLTVQGGGSFSFGSSGLYCRNLFLASNGWITVTTAQPLNPSGDVVIQPGGGIMAEGTGSGPGLGPGAGRGTYSGSKGGGGYGGYGGISGSETAYSGQAYGSVSNPTQAGSGGANGSGTSYSPLGGAGGGTIVLNTRGSVRVDGCISANGTPGDTDSGGGSGGSVWLTVGTLSGSGAISANGGPGKGLGGGGGGGRIALYYTSNLFSGTLTALGGAGTPPGGAGTLYSRKNNQPFGQVVVDNGGLSGMGSSLGSGLSSSTDLVLQNGAIFGLQAGITLHNLVIRPNSWLVFSNASALVLNGDATIQPGGGIVADAAGFAAGQGPGTGGSLSVGSSGPSGGGGGHGGFGATSAFAAGGGKAYDSTLSPNLAGSGGGNGLGNSPFNRGGAGGGIINLHVIGNLQNDGRISANGGNGVAPSSGGGAGGSLLLWARTLAGAGTIAANGGAGNGWGGGGGGGRIAINCLSNLFSGPIYAFGGSGADWGGAGTVYVAPTSDWNHGRVLVDNSGHFGTNTAIAASGPINLVVQGGARALPADGYLLLSNLIVRADGTLTSSGACSNLDVAVLGDALIESGGLISVDGLGFAQSVGPGSGLSSNFVGSGAGYGGAGGAAPFLAGGPIYGSAQRPVDCGSGGGLGWGLASGGQGGGALRLSVGGTLTLNGRLSANGNPGGQEDAGGGSGGSIWLSAGSLVGNGSLAAEGGSGELYQGGGGGGGRIALYTPANSFAGSISAAGGRGWSDGGTGSVFFASNFDLPVLLAQTPVGVVSNALGYIDLTFNNPVNPEAVWYPGFVLDTPIGTIPGAAVAVASQGTSTLRFYLPLQTTVGAYTLHISHSLARDIFGQSLAADYTNTFSIVLPLIEGRILDTNGLPVPDVLVRPDSGSSAITDANGYYALGAPPGYSFGVTPSKPGLMFVPGTRYYTNVTGGFSSQDYLAVTTIAPVVQTDCTATNLVMNWLGIPGVSYQPFASTNLVDWYPYSGQVLGTNGPMCLQLPIGTEPCRFYRLRAAN